jgi:prepilin-type N-terminal cleavage/methylation domain-containing protein
MALNKKRKSTNGFTLVELVVVLVILAVLVAIAVPNIVGHINTANKSVDEANLKLLNDATFYYATFKDVPIEEVFIDVSTDDSRMQKLLDAGYLDYMLEPRQEGLSFSWNTDDSIWELTAGDSLMTGFIDLMTNSGISLSAFLSKSSTFKFSSSKYSPDSWNGYLEKLLETGDVESNNRVSENEGSNTLNYQNPISGKETIIDFTNWNSIKNTCSDYIPPAIFITNSNSFDYTASNHDYITDNIDTLKGTMVFYKDNASANEDVQIYYINEDGSLSDLYSIEDVISD